MPVPPDPVLRAARRWLERLPDSGPARCRALFTNHAEFSDLTPTQYDTAYTWVQSLGLLELDATAPLEARVLLFDAAIADSGAAWLPDADTLVQSPDELPDDALRAAAALGLDAEQAFARALGVWGKVDTAERARVGSAGEHELMRLLCGSVAAEVEHVAAHSDHYGYDIAVRAANFDAHLEVKATARRTRLAVFISRHEFETMRRDPTWHLVVVRLCSELRASAIASVAREWILAQAPADRRHGRWESCRLDIPPSVETPGVQALAPVLSANAPGLLTGTRVWGH